MQIPKLPPLPSPIGLKISASSVENVNGSAPTQKADEAQQAKLKQTCKDFESVFLNYLLSKMRETVPKSDLMGKSQGEEMYRGMAVCVLVWGKIIRKSM